MSFEASRREVAAPARAARIDPEALLQRFRHVRGCSLRLAAPLSAEDAMLQSMPDASPAKWHLAHTTWFFERFVLARDAGYQPSDPTWDYLFNSYYHSIGPMHDRPRRGMLSRPSLAQVLDYRARIDDRIERIARSGALDDAGQDVLLLGTQHEQQHQELMLTDIKHAFGSNPLRPAYRDDLRQPEFEPDDADFGLRWIAQPARTAMLGAPSWPGAEHFAFDNESPTHPTLLAEHALAQRPVSNREFRDFIHDGGYRTASLWLSDGWSRIEVDPDRWSRPLYWDRDLDRHYTLAGMREIDPRAPVCHLSYLEADAFARWAGARLPTEAEWEAAARTQRVEGNFADDDRLQPVAAGAGTGSLRQLFGDVWEWTSSAYTPYPGFRPLPGSLGEYNGKFMCGQWVLRGGSCATPRDHIRATYRNFFHPPDRWQFSGLRLARDLP